MATTFRDADGRDWTLRLTVGLLEEVKEGTGVDLTRVVTSPDGLGDVLFADPRTIVKVLWVIVAAQADKAGVTPESFGYSFDGEAVERATEALVGSVLDFFPRSRPARAMRERLPSILTRADDLMIEAMGPSTSSPTAGDSPARSGSTPGP